MAEGWESRVARKMKNVGKRLDFAYFLLPRRLIFADAPRNFVYISLVPFGLRARMGVLLPLYCGFPVAFAGDPRITDLLMSTGDFRNTGLFFF